jgi:DNA-binding SARP family transcriptional activator
VAVPPVLRVELLGGFRVLIDGRSSTHPPSARQQELITFLILFARNAPIQRQRVAGSLWPESSDAQALTNLRRELHYLREGWPRLDALIHAGSGTVAWCGAVGAIVDLVAFEAAADRGLEGDCDALREAASRY